MTLLRIFLAVAWLVIAYVTVRAVSQLGVAGGNIFFSDFSQPWRAQFNTDFGFHLLLMAGWIFYREKSTVAGVLCGMGAIFLGGFFSMAYILVATIRAKGHARVLLLGNHA
jgi:hypothetical protein